MVIFFLQIYCAWVSGVGGISEKVDAAVDACILLRSQSPVFVEYGLSNSARIKQAVGAHTVLFSAQAFPNIVSRPEAVYGGQN